MWQLAISACATLVAALLECRDTGFVASWTSDRVRRNRNVAYLLSNLVVVAVLAGTTAWIGFNIPGLVRWELPFAVEAVACILVAELFNWLFHWIKHVHPWLWRFHLQHHVEQRYDISLTLHTHGLEVVVAGAVMAVGLRLAGFSAAAVEVFSTLYYVANLYKHGSWRVGLGWLDAVVVSPAFHRLHHAREVEGNYGSILTLYDVLFRTAVWPDERAWTLAYGTKSPEPFGYWAEFVSFMSPPGDAGRGR